MQSERIVCLVRVPGKLGKVAGLLECDGYSIRSAEFDTWEEVRSVAMGVWLKLYPKALILIECPSGALPITPMAFMAYSPRGGDLYSQRVRLLELSYFSAMNKVYDAAERYQELLREIADRPLDKCDEA